METIKKLDQQRHELKALRYLLDFFPQSMQNRDVLPSRDDFQIADCQLIYDVLLSAKTQEEATTAIAALDVEDTDLESFLRLGGKFYHAYPAMVKGRGQEFRTGQVRMVVPEE
ncbi:MAG: hypothetical protein AB7G75_23100 [Candidatus Binatia bacterium]